MPELGALQHLQKASGGGVVVAGTGVRRDGEFCRVKGNVEGRPRRLRRRDFGCGQGWQGDWKPGAGKRVVPVPGQGAQCIPGE